MTTCPVCGNSGNTPDFLANHTCQTVTLEMWTVNLDGSPGDTYVMSFPVTMRKHDMLRKLAGYALAVPNAHGTWVRPSRSDIRVNSVQGVAWLKSDVSRVAYFQN